MASHHSQTVGFAESAVQKIVLLLTNAIIAIAQGKSSGMSLWGKDGFAIIVKTKTKRMLNRAVYAGYVELKMTDRYHNIILMAVLFIFCFFANGCGSLKLHERKADEANPNDLGSVTELELKGPKAQLSHKF